MDQDQNKYFAGSFQHDTGLRGREDAYRNPMWKRILVVLMRVVGWVILIPSALAFLGSAIMVTLASFTLNPGAFIVWSVISGVMGGLTALGVLMTGVAKDKD